MNFTRRWTQVALEAEYDHFGTSRLVKAHNEQIATLQSQLAASQERERILRDGLKKYSGCRDIDGNYSVAATIKAAEEVK